MPQAESTSPAVLRDLSAGLVVFLVALPLCLGVALASGAPLLAGLIAGVVGGIVIGLVSGSHTSVSGPSPGPAAVVAGLIASLGSFEAFLLAVVLAGVIQIVLGALRAGFLAAFFPSAVIKGFLAAIGVLIVLKQIPHVAGQDPDPVGDMAFEQPDHRNTFTELVETIANLDLGAALIGLGSVALLVLWERSKRLKSTPFPAPLVVVLFGVGMTLLFREIGGTWTIEESHRVQVPTPSSPSGFLDLLRWPDFSKWLTPSIYVAALTLAAVATLETLLNLEAVDKIDPRQRTSPPSRELIAQGIGNVVCGLVGGLPITSVIVRSSVNVNAGARTKWSAVFHGVLILVCVVFLAPWLNLIPLSCLAAILLVTGVKLASPALVRRMWSEGRSQFAPFAATVLAMVFTDMLTGVLLGLAASIGFILWSNVRRPTRVLVEKHLGGEVVHIVLANQVSFLNRAALAKILDKVPSGGRLLLDATDTDYIDPDILDLLRDFREQTAPARGVTVNLTGFRSRYQMEDETQYVDYSTRELQETVTPEQVLQFLKDGHERFRSGRRLKRDFGRQVSATASGQHPLAVVLGCIDSRTPAELIFDLGVGDIFVVRVAGNVPSAEVLGSIEYACAAAGAKLVLVMGHTRCGAITAAVDLAASGRTAAEATGCAHIDPIVRHIQRSIDVPICWAPSEASADEKLSTIDSVARRNVRRAVASIHGESEALSRLVREGRIMVVGAMYDVASGNLEFLPAEDGPSN